MTFPSLNTKESKKDSSYHQQFVEAIVSRSLNSSYGIEFATMQECYDYYDRASSPDDFRYLQEAPDFSALPAQWQPINKIRNKVKVLLGELWERDYDFRVKSINKDAKIRKLDAKEEMRVTMRLQKYAKELEAYSGMTTAAQGYVPQTEEELEDYFNKSYKEKAEIIMYWAVKFLDKLGGWSIKRSELFRDLLIAGKCVVKHEIINGIPAIKRIDPRFFIHDSYAEGEFIEDSSYFGRLEYMTIADAAEKYGLSAKELEDCHGKYSQFARIASAKSGQALSEQEVSSFSTLGDKSGLKWFKETESGLRVLVMEACWADYKRLKYKESEDKYGNTHMKKMNPDAQERENVTSKNIKTYRQGTLIGGLILKNWGEVPNQPRDHDSLHETKPPYTVLVPDFLNGRSVSIVEQMKGLQNLKDIFTYNVLLSVARAGAKGFVYDVSQCPDGWDVATVIKYLKTVGIAFVNSKAGGTPSQFNQFQSIDLSLSDSVTRYLELSQWVDSEMDSVSGINEARQGVIQGASQGLGVTRSALLQSSLTTAPLFSLFDEFSTRVWNQQARLVKIAFPENPERFATIIGDTGIDFLANEIDLEMDDYAVFVEVTPKILTDINSFHQLVMAGLQAGSVSFEHAMILLMEQDVQEGILKYEKLARKQKEEDRAHEEEMMAKQEQMRTQGEQKLAQWNAQQSAAASQKAMELQQSKQQGDITKELVKQRGDYKKTILESQLNGNKV